ncbi:MAG TPA: sterol desaturase family protein [Pirellulales bacterium]|nr:sterol desaturase family protein [Pirellulales bacterium]
MLPAGHLYYRYHVRRDRRNPQLRIQKRQPAEGQIRREVMLSLLTILIFAGMSTVLLELYKSGHTSIYRNVHAYPLYYLPASFVLCLFIHDTYFYWLHRFMHWAPVFKYLHLGHHRSVCPTPFAIFAFQPAEAVLQFCGICNLVIFLPLHPAVLLAFLWYDTTINTAGHTGYEMVPKAVATNWLYSGFNTVTHHDTHHTNLKVNFGAYFNTWDRWMGTFLDRQVPPANELTSQDCRAPKNRERTFRNPETAFAAPLPLNRNRNPGVADYPECEQPQAPASHSRCGQQGQTNQKVPG